MSINYKLTIKVTREKDAKDAPYVAYVPEFDLSSAGKTEKQAIKNVKEVVDIMFEEAKADGNIEALLDELGLSEKDSKKHAFPKIIIDSYSLSF